MQTLYIKLVPVEKQVIELRYSLNEPGRYETQQLNLASIDNLLRKARSTYYMLLPDPKSIGKQLFFWLDGSGRWLSRAINSCIDEGLVLAIDVEERLRHLPWETLHDGERFLVERTNPVVVPVRWIASTSSNLREAEPRPLRILFMATSPDGVEPILDFEQEESQILTTIGDLPLNLRVEESGCIAELAKSWSRYREPFDIFHLTGHASIEEEPFFWTETDTGEAYRANAAEIAAALRFRLPKLVFLSGCRTGEADSDGVLSSLAEALIQEGCQSVLGWGRPVSDVVATRTTAHLYGKLAAGYEVTEALQSTYQHLLKNQVKDWHLLRLYFAGRCPQALVEPLGDQIWLPAETAYEQFLDSEGLIRVATPEAFVGRRRVIQRSLKALRSTTNLGVLLHGLGGVGKSTVAARLIERTVGYDRLVVYRRLDEDKLLRQLAEQCISETGQEILQGKLPLPQKLTKFLREGLNTDSQRFIFILDDFEENLEVINDGLFTLKTDVVMPLAALLKAIQQSRLPHKIIITSRYDFEIPNLNRLLVREHLTALQGADLQKKCNRLESFQFDSKVDSRLRKKAVEVSFGNPRLLELLNKVLQSAQLDYSRILESMENKAEEFRESILIDEILKQQPLKLQKMLSYTLAYELPVPKSAIKVLCPRSFDIDSYIRRAVAIGILDRISSEDGDLYYVPRIIKSSLLDFFPEDSIELYRTAAEHLEELWLTQKFVRAINHEDMKSATHNPITDFIHASEQRLLELYRLAVISANPDLLTQANWFLSMHLNAQGRYRETASLCEFVHHEAFKDLNIKISTYNLHHLLAVAQEHIGEVDKALENYHLALQLCLKCSKPNDDFYTTTKASIMYGLASVYFTKGDYEKALELNSEVIKIDRDSLGKAKSYNQLGLIMQALERPEEALESYKLALEFADSADDRDMVSAIKMNAASIQVDQGLGNAWDDLLEDHDFSNLEEDTKIAALVNTAALRKKQGKLDEAKEILDYLEVNTHGIQDVQLKAITLNNLATFNSDCGCHERALELFNKSLTIFRDIGDRTHEAVVLQEIGVFYERRGDIDRAIGLLEQAFQIASDINKKDIQVYILSRIAEFNIDQSRLDEAETKLYQALDIAEYVASPEKKAFLFRELGRLKVHQKKYEAGLDFYEQALEECYVISDAILKATVLKLLGELLTFLGKIDKSLKHLKQSLKIYQELHLEEDANKVESLISEALLYEPAQLYQRAKTEAEEGNLGEAIELLEKALPMIRELGEKEIEAKALFSVGNMRLEQGDLKKGFMQVVEAVEFAKQNNFSEIEHLENIAEVVQLNSLEKLFAEIWNECESKSYERALDRALILLELAEMSRNVYWTAKSLAVLGQIQAQLDNYHEGIESLDKSLNLAQKNAFADLEEFQKVRSAVNANEAIRLYEEACFAAEQRNLNEAIEFAEKAYNFQNKVEQEFVQPATLGLLGQLYCLRGDSQKGLETLQQGLSIAKELEIQEVIEDLEAKFSVWSKRCLQQDKTSP